MNDSYVTQIILGTVNVVCTFGGLYVVEAADLDAAIAIARQIPLAKDGAVEVRPLIPTPDGAAG